MACAAAARAMSCICARVVSSPGRIGFLFWVGDNWIRI